MRVYFGSLWDFRLPVNKELWTSYFAVVTVVWSAKVLAVCELVDWGYISLSVFSVVIDAVAVQYSYYAECIKEKYSSVCNGYIGIK
ncbi:MAG: hypothetical protein ACTJH9_10625 [Pseudoalteromonas sp.]|uniref:hypothetical protein n=1 Tax=unclassified Pseudoalteromonas TaxID=194690 RepID=UPI003F9E3AED